MCFPFKSEASVVPHLIRLFPKPFSAMYSIHNISLSGAQQTPCDTIPVPQNLVVSEVFDPVTSSVNPSQLPFIESIAPQSASTSQPDMGQGQQASFQSRQQG
jgi:hypothetical protein